MRLLLIEDDSPLRETLARQLAAEGFAIEQAADGRQGRYCAVEYPVDLAIIDLGLPEVAGIDIIRAVREAGKTYPILDAGPVTLDMSRQELKVDGRCVDLTGFEYRIVEYLMLRAGEVISKTELTERLYDQDFERDSNVIEVFIGRLRRKLDPDNRLKPIETLRGRGYRFALARH